MTRVLQQPATAVAPAATGAGPSPLRRAFELIGSMKLAVVLLLYLFFVTFVGTIAQTQLDAYTVQKEIFEAWLASSPHLGQLRFPGGLPAMGLLFVNLVVGGVLRLRWRWRNAGILVTHFGILLLLVAGWVKYAFSVSGHLALFEGRANSVFVSFYDYELALLRQDGDRVLERVVPAPALAAAADGDVEVAAAGLPFTVTVQHWFEHCRPMRKGPMFETDTPVVDGVFLMPRPLPVEKTMCTAGCYVRVTERQGGKVHEGILWGAERRPFSDTRPVFAFEVAGVRWGLDLRRVTWDLPFTVRLDKFSKRDHPGTSNPRDFSSYVTVLEHGAERPVHIFMNNPLRMAGLVFYQTNWGPQDERDPPQYYSVFEVARNPSDMWPKYACYVIAVGLLLHFGRKLYLYIRGQTRERGSAAEARA